MNTDTPRQSKTYVGWDIGGAHLKVARILSDGSIETVLQTACPLWQGIDKLEEAYHSVCDTLPTNDIHVVTMTGELADSFSDRKQGVYRILDAMAHLLQQSFAVYTGNEGIVNNEAIADIESVASRNWQATGEWLAERCREGILIDMGSTTTDIVPFKSGRIKVQGDNDATRMRYGELIYTGISRTPIMAIADRFDIDGVNYPIMAEYFATIADVYRLLGELPEDADLYPTCDNAAKTMDGSAKRIERMFGCDWDGDMRTARVKAQAIAKVQQLSISRALSTLLERNRLSERVCVIGAGSGYKIVQCIAEDLGLQFMPYHRLLNNLPKHLEDIACRCATAIAVADLERLKYL